MAEDMNDILPNIPKLEVSQDFSCSFCEKVNDTTIAQCIFCFKCYHSGTCGIENPKYCNNCNFLFNQAKKVKVIEAELKLLRRQADKTALEMPPMDDLNKSQMISQILSIEEAKFKKAENPEIPKTENLHESDQSGYESEESKDLKARLLERKKLKTKNYTGTKPKNSQNPEKIQSNSHFQSPASLNNNSNTFQPENYSTLGKAIEEGICLGFKTGFSQIVSQPHEEQLPTFDGKNILLFPSWLANAKTIFEGKTNKKVLEILRKSLTNEAKILVERLLYNENNVERISEILRATYGKPEKHAEIFRDRLGKMHRATKADKYLIDLNNLLEDFISSMENTNSLNLLLDNKLCNLVISKLPEIIQFEWQKIKAEEDQLLNSVKSNKFKADPLPQHETQSLIEIRDFLKKYVIIAHNNSVSIGNPTQTLAKSFNVHVESKIQEKSKRNPRRKNNHKSNFDSSSKNKFYENTQKNCELCKESVHFIYQCDTFKKLSVVERWDLIRKREICGYCLKGSSHSFKDCQSKKECSIDGCTGYHHPLLHSRNRQIRNNRFIQGRQTQPSQNNSVNKTSATESAPQVDSRSESTMIHKRLQNSPRYVILPISAFDEEQNPLDCFVMIDNGSSCSLIDQSLADKLNICGTKDPLTLVWSDGSIQEHENSERVTLTLAGRPCGKKLRIDNVRTVTNLSLPSQSQNARELSKFEHLKDIKLSNFYDAKPLILLGLRHSYFTAPEETRKGVSPDQPIAIRTPLGWSVYGSSKTDKENFSLSIQEIEHETPSLEKMLNDFFELDNLGAKIETSDSLTDQEKRADMLMEKYMYHDGKRYQVPLLWDTDEIYLKDNFYITLKRLEFLEKQLEKNPTLKQFYCEKIETYVQDGFLKKLTESEAKVKTWRTNYIPHFLTINPKKPKPRIVLDAAAGGQNALNAHLLKGQDLITSLLEILLQFRLNKFAFIGDVKEMFSNIGIIKMDQQAQRILWRNCDPKAEPQEYVFTRMLFGPTDSPFKSQYIKNYNANLFKDSLPLGSEAIKNHTYIDDLAISYPSEATAKQAALESIKIYEHGGFQLRNFVSNSKEVLSALPKENVATQVEHSLNLLCKTPILGMTWITSIDSLVIRFDPNNIDKEILLGNRIPTKREVLSINGSIYDPLGIAAYITFFGKILFQKICKETSEWDTKISDSCFVEWLKWLSKLSEISKIEIPRFYSPNLEPNSSPIYELNTFVDASQNIYAAVVYLVTKYNDKTDVAFVFGKSKVANKTLNTIPKLELQSAVLGIRLSKTTEKALKLNIASKRYFSDSEIILYQINNLNKKQSQFQHTRVKEIREHSTPEQWFHIPSDLNPADSGTKHKTNPKWITGPDFLNLDKNFWPSSIVNISVKQESLNVNIENKKKFDLIKPENFSSFRRMIKITILVKKQFLRFAKKPVTDRFTADEVKWAKNYLIKQAQYEAFCDEIETIKSGQNITKGPLKGLNPYLDENEILRCDGRLQNATSVPESAKNPIIIPKGGRIKDLLIREYHEKYFHHGQNSVKAALLKQYWLIGLNQSLRKAIYNCQFCKNKAAKPYPPQMANLPSCRLQPYVKPFTFTGVDYMGPFDVTIGRRHEKRWVALFTCLTFRCCHLELAFDLSADSFLICLENLLSRRGTVKEIYSDNATNFIGAKKIVERELAFREIKFTQIPPGSPHFGGVWEKLVHLTKKTLNILLKEHAPREHTFISFLYQAEHICNSRPLTDIALESHTDEFLTPNHFLLGPLGGEVTELTYGPEIKASRKQLHIMHSLALNFKNRFNDEIIPLLNFRKKWPNKSEPLKVNDVVLILEDNKISKFFKKGVITEIFKANDGQVRFANVKTSTGIFKRPAVKIAVLDVKGETQNSPNLPSEEITQSEPVNETLAIRPSNLDTKLSSEINTQTSVEPMPPTMQPNVRSRRFRNRQPFSYKHFFLMFVLSLMTSALGATIDTISESGLFMAHVQNVYSQTGVAEWTINTGIDVKKDDEHFYYKLQILKLICRKADKVDPSIECAPRIQYLTDMRQFVNEEVKKLRYKRSDGILPIVFHWLFGSSSTEDELEEIRAKERQTILETKKVLQMTADKFDKSMQRSTSKLQALSTILDSATNLVNKYSQNIAKIELINKINQAIQIVELYLQDLKIKYDSVQNGLAILSNDELETSIHQIRTELRDFSILPPVNNTRLVEISQQNVQVVDNMLIIRVYLPILYHQRFEQYQLVAIPDFETGKIMSISHKYICVDSITKTYFYPKDNGVKISDDIAIIANNVFLTGHDDKSNCVTKAFFNELRKKRQCDEVTTLPEHTTAVISLPKHHQYIFYTSDPTSISLSCKRSNEKRTLNPLVNRTQKFTAGMINAEPGCVIYSPGQFIVSNTEDKISTRVSGVYFHPFKLPDVNSTNTTDAILKLRTLESNLSSTINTTESSLLNDVNDGLSLLPDTEYHVHHVISGSSIALSIITLLILALYFCLRKKPININVSSPANSNNENQLMSSFQLPIVPRIPQIKNETV